MFPYLKVVVFPKQLRLLISEALKHCISTGHVIPFESKTPNYIYIIPILLRVYLNAVCFLIVAVLRADIFTGTEPSISNHSNKYFRLMKSQQDLITYT